MSATVFHVTHWKAGSQWVRAVLEAAAGDRVVPLKHDMSHVHTDPIVEGGVYTPVYMGRARFVERVGLREGHRRFVVVRDLRDTLVSWYFSLKRSKRMGEINPNVASMQRMLEEMSLRDGLGFLVRERLGAIAQIQSEWLEGDDPYFRYEDLMADEHAGFARILGCAGIEMDEGRRRAIVEANSFERRSKGRKPGEEDVSSHLRKGTGGDWRELFDAALSREFKDRFGEVLVKTGYERDAGW